MPGRRPQPPASHRPGHHEPDHRGHRVSFCNGYLVPNISDLLDLGWFCPRGRLLLESSGTRMADLPNRNTDLVGIRRRAAILVQRAGRRKTPRGRTGRRVTRPGHVTPERPRRSLPKDRSRPKSTELRLYDRTDESQPARLANLDHHIYQEDGPSTRAEGPTSWKLMPRPALRPASHGNKPD